jgi:hypothetical protein
VWEGGLTTSECALGRACMEHDAERARTEAIRQDYLTKSGTLTSCTKHSHNFYKMLEEIEILLSLHKKDLKV